MSHTKTPWGIKRFDCPENVNCAVIGSENFDTCLAPSRCDEERANAAFIVKACNSFYIMKEALEKIQKLDGNIPVEHSPALFSAMSRIAREAIKQAETDNQ